MTQTQEQYIKMVELAKQNKHFEFTLITSLTHLKNVKVYKNFLKGFLRGIKKSVSKILKTYKNNILTTEDTADCIMFFSDADICLKFYSEELVIIEDMLDEFRSYLWSGHFLDIYLFNRTREEKDMIDMRGYVHESNSGSDNEGC